MFRDSGVKHLIDSAVKGYSATIFAYGPTGSGKTFSIAGVPEKVAKKRRHEDITVESTDGLIVRSIAYLFEAVRAYATKFQVRASCLEIYNETVIDLLDKKGEALAVRFDTAAGSFFVDRLAEVQCGSDSEVIRLFAKGMEMRRVAEHQLNRDSSRSHCLLTVHIDSVQMVDGHEQQCRGKITFVDLAGSERLKDSQSAGSTLKETGSINRSLFTLGKVISSLCDKKSVKAPYRDSKLTQLLMDSVGGTSMTIMLACISPSQHSVAETLRTLDYAARAKNIKNKPVVLLDPQQNIVKELKMEIQALREENQRLRDALAQKAAGAGGASSLPPPSSFFGSIESAGRVSKFENSGSKFGASLAGTGGAYSDAGRPPKKVRPVI